MTNDSYTLEDLTLDRPGYIRAQPRLHGPLRFTYRLQTVDQRAAFQAMLKKHKEDDHPTLQARMLAKHVKSWNVVDPSGKSVLVSHNALLSLPPGLFDRLYLIVVGFSAPDEMPVDGSNQQATEARDEFADYDNLLEASASGKPYGDVALEAERKN